LKMSFRKKGREITITLPRTRTVMKIVLAIALIMLAVGGTVAFLTRPVELFRDIRTPFEIDFTENIQTLLLVYENGTLIKPIIGGHGGRGAYASLFRCACTFPFSRLCPVLQSISNL